MFNKGSSQPNIPLISLTTDFGLTDEYVGVMKGVILRSAPLLTIVDLCHHIEAGNVLQAAFLLSENFHYFPDNSLHVVVVDPGVGTNRKILLARSCRQFFLAPDNGVLSFIVGLDNETCIRQVTNRDLFLTPLSTTFHGRDIFAPVAGALGAGLSAGDVGPATAVDTMQRLTKPSPTLGEDNITLTGMVIGADHFGNLLTNIHQRDLWALPGDPLKLSVHIAGSHIEGLSESYGQRPGGSLVALIGSRGYLEIARSGGNARQYLKVGSGQTLTVRKAI